MYVIIILILISITNVVSFSYKIKAFVTGGNGILGNELIKSFDGYDNINSNNCHLIYTTREPCDFRSKSKCKTNSNSMITNQILDLESLSLSSSSSSFPVNDSFFCDENIKHIILINNAGVCLPGNDMTTITRSLLVNTIAPIELAMLLLNDKRLKNDHKRDIEIVIVNISSGEGELVYLNSKIRKNLEMINDIDTWKKYVLSLHNLHDDDEIEVAFGDTPWYSLSKALLNHATLLLHRQCNNPDKIQYHNKNVRILAVCPGDFVSPMTSRYDMEVAQTQSAREAADAIWKLALSKKDDYPSGHFYRDLEQIHW